MDSNPYAHNQSPWPLITDTSYVMSMVLSIRGYITVLTTLLPCLTIDVFCCRMPKSHSESEVQSLAMPSAELEASPMWKAIQQRHAAEEIRLRRSHLDKQTAVLLQLLGAIHETRCKDLTMKQER